MPKSVPEPTPDREVLKRWLQGRLQEQLLGTAWHIDGEFLDALVREVLAARQEQADA